MISRLTIAGLGPHAETDLDLSADGLTELEGGSGAGKSTLLDALCYLLWGVSRQGTALPLEQLSAEKAALSLTVGKTGSVLARTINNRRSETRSLSRGGTTETFASNEALGAKLGHIGASPTTGRLVVVPFAWRDLLTEKLGRPFRDALLAVLPKGDLRAVVTAAMGEAGFELRADDPLDLKAALAYQTASNRARDEAGGAATAAHQAATRAEASPDRVAPPSAELERARGVLALADAWARANSSDADRTRLDAELAEVEHILAQPAPSEVDDTEARSVVDLTKRWAGYRSELARHQERIVRRDEVRVRRAELGPQPTQDPAALKAKTEQLARLDAGIKVLRASAAKARAEANVAAAKLDAIRAHAGTCPTCGQAWAKQAEVHMALAGEAAAAETKATEEESRLARNEGTLAALTKEVQALHTRVDECRAWAQRSRDIGPDVDVGPPPTAPVSTEPTAEEISAAHAQLAEAALAVAARKAHAKTAADASKRRTALQAELGKLPPLERPTESAPTADDLARARGVLDAHVRADRADEAFRSAAALHAEAVLAHHHATAEAVRREVLVRVVRAAPTEIARSQIAALGDLGPVEIAFPEKVNAQSPEIEVRIFGRPWWLASDGEQVLADAWLRAGIRRAAKLNGLPLVIDRPQDWSGEWPAFPGPVWFLRTTDGDLRVSR